MGGFWGKGVFFWGEEQLGVHGFRGEVNIYFQAKFGPSILKTDRVMVDVRSKHLLGPLCGGTTTSSSDYTSTNSTITGYLLIFSLSPHSTNYESLNTLYLKVSLICKILKWCIFFKCVMFNSSVLKMKKRIKT